MRVRPAVIDDAAPISVFLKELVNAGKRNLPADIEFVRSQYITHPDTIQCSVAEDDDGTLLGLQILKRATEGNPYGVTAGWGIIGTHVSLGAARRGVGKALFVSTSRVAREAGLALIDATISARNAEGLAYYEAIGFRTYKSADGRVCKKFAIS